jgi:hypothetical protein
VPSLTQLSPTEVADLVVEVVAAEGPVRADVVYDALRAASGAARGGKNIRDALDKGVASAVRSGAIVKRKEGADNVAVLRLPEQPEVLLRDRRDRNLYRIPPSELSEFARRVAEREPHLDREQLKRRMSPLLSWKQYTRDFDEVMETALPPVNRTGFGGDSVS